MALIQCPECGKEFSDKAAACPNCGCPTEEAIVILNENNYYSNYIDEENNSKPKESGFGKIPLILVIIGILVLIFIFFNYANQKEPEYKKDIAMTTTTDTDTYTSPDVGYDEDISGLVTDYESIQEDYSYDSSETIGQRNALKSAESYLNYSAFSYSGLIKQLEYEQFSHEDAVYAADNCGADWNEQAAKSAKSYLDYSSFSRSGLIDQLVYEGFSYDQAVYGVDANGY
jgi:hypothetical protein